jgi:hypothetical protein
VVSAGVAASGYSDPSPAVTVVPTKPPATVTGVAVVGGVKTLTVSWKAPTTTDGLTGFVATATSAGITPVTCTAVVTATTCSMPSLTPAVYSVTVVAKGATVSSAPSTAVEGTAITAVAPTLPGTLPASGGTLTITGTPKAGSTVIVNGTGFAPFTGVTIGLYTPLVNMKTVTTGSTGGFTVEVTIPTGNTGSKTIVAGGQTSATNTAVKYLTAAVTVA